MCLTRRFQLLIVVPLVAGLAVACERAQALEEIPEGTDVTIELKDGQHVSGKLVSVKPEVVALGTGGARQVEVERAEIDSVKSGEAAREAVREVSIAAGTRLASRLETTLASNTSRAGDPVRATLTAPLVVDEATIAPEGSSLLGTVTSARSAGRVKGRSELSVRFERLETNGVTYDIRTLPIRWVGDDTKGEDAAKIGIGAAAGAVIGAITGGKKGAAVGSAIGAGGGTAIVLSTKGGEIEIASGASLDVKLSEALRVTVPAKADR